MRADYIYCYWLLLLLLLLPALTFMIWRGVFFLFVFFYNSSPIAKWLNYFFLAMSAQKKHTHTLFCVYLCMWRNSQINNSPMSSNSISRACHMNGWKKGKHKKKLESKSATISFICFIYVHNIQIILIGTMGCLHNVLFDVVFFSFVFSFCLFFIDFRALSASSVFLFCSFVCLFQRQTDRLRHFSQWKNSDTIC